MFTFRNDLELNCSTNHTAAIFSSIRDLPVNVHISCFAQKLKLLPEKSSSWTCQPESARLSLSVQYFLFVCNTHLGKVAQHVIRSDVQFMLREKHTKKTKGFSQDESVQADSITQPKTRTRTHSNTNRTSWGLGTFQVLSFPLHTPQNNSVP